RRTEKVRGRLRRATDAAYLRRAMRRHVELEEGLHDRGRDRVVPAAGAERRHPAFVVADREAERVPREALVDDPGLDDRRHAVTPCSLASCTASTTVRQSIGSPP